MKFFYVYQLVSLGDPARHYTGFTEDLEERLRHHNSGACPHTAKFRPWKIDTCAAFSDREKALAFERYLKSHSGRAFAHKHF
ncbi:MAG: GIY-YIG nuclease family protein [Kiritimatiellaeota bacterium]|nr:GIY-YIG nuclease family protein [Kiritimatiellota bacterium]